jgi:hypothetical protein
MLSKEELSNLALPGDRQESLERSFHKEENEENQESLESAVDCLLVPLPHLP